jgi:hypothetical protein
MVEGLTIRGGAGPFEAAVIAVVLDRIAEEQRGVSQGSSRLGRGLSPWMTAVLDDEPDWPVDVVDPSRG